MFSIFQRLFPYRAVRETTNPNDYGQVDLSTGKITFLPKPPEKQYPTDIFEEWRPIFVVEHRVSKWWQRPRYERVGAYMLNHRYVQHCIIKHKEERSSKKQEIDYYW